MLTRLFFCFFSCSRCDILTKLVPRRVLYTADLLYLGGMNEFTRYPELRWADIDPNLHLRHSVYYDLGAYSRMEFLNENGITAEFMHQRGFGPIIFREECVFKREIRLEDKIRINLLLASSHKDFSRWTMQHQIFKNDEIVAAIITLDGAWIDVAQRKLTVPPPEVAATFDNMPRAEAFEWTEKKSKI
jgi:acyl-CoA thioester hydrolase